MDNLQLINKILKNLDFLDINQLNVIYDILAKVPVYQDVKFCDGINGLKTLNSTDYTDCGLSNNSGGVHGHYNTYNKLTEQQVLYYASLSNPNINIHTPYNNKLCNTLKEIQPSATWLKKQRTYMSTLSESDIEILSGYSRRGDAIINNFARENVKVSIELFKSVGYQFLFAKNLSEHITVNDLSDIGLENLKKYNNNFNKYKKALSENVVENVVNNIKDDAIIRGLYTVIKRLNIIINNAPPVDTT